ncbi:NfeD family protein [Haloimpatiens sp. FM7315]|uniref:NfeD family protein n=1 Tax=Haloimpatiens sp. FM7315 TaxID=3298609 RepID=UPI0035A3CEA6
MRQLFYICFVTGILYTLISVLLGGIFDVCNIGVDLDFNFEFPFLSFLKPVIIMTFLIVFGGIGLLGLNKGWKHIFLIAFILGFVTAFLMWRLVIVNLMKAQNTSCVNRKELIGLTATVIETIRQNGIGAISYSVNGNKYSSPAKNSEDYEISRGKKVIIVKINQNIFYVNPLDELKD